MIKVSKIKCFKPNQQTLNTTGKKGPKIRSEPFIKSEIIDKVDEKTAIYYKNEWELDGNRYWLKVYLPEKKIEGWLNGNLVAKKQLQKLMVEVNDYGK